MMRQETAPPDQRELMVRQLRAILRVLPLAGLPTTARPGRDDRAGRPGLLTTAQEDQP